MFVCVFVRVRHISIGVLSVLRCFASSRMRPLSSHSRVDRSSSPAAFVLGVMMLRLSVLWSKSDSWLCDCSRILVERRTELEIERGGMRE